MVAAMIVAMVTAMVAAMAERSDNNGYDRAK